MKRIITLFLLLVFACSLGAQVETRGSDFWVTFGNNANAPSNGVYLQLRIVAKQAVTGRITFTENNKVVPFSISDNDVFNYTLTQEDRAASYSLETGISSKSIRIQTDNDIPVTVYAFNTYAALADATNLLPVPTLGSDYYHLGRAAVSSNFTDNYMVVATQDNTIVYENGSDVAHLSKGQVYFRRADNMSQDLSGRHITSNNPIAYFTAHNYHQIDGGGDNIFQQLTSVETWGTKFIVPVSLRGVELIRIVASHNNTKVTQTGAVLPKTATPAQQTYTLNAGEFVELQISLANKGCYIESDKPVQVCSYMVGMNYNNGAVGNGDESLVWIPPVEQSVQTALIAPFGSDRLSSHYALIVTPTATKEKTTIKIGAGQTMLLSSQNGTWYDNPSSGMSFYNLQLTESSASYLFDNEEGLIVYGYGFGSFISYYYMAASSLRQLNPSFYINDVHFQNANGQTYCNGSFKFKAELNFPLSANPGHIKWYVNGVEEPTAQDKIEWTKSSFPLKTPQEIKLVVIGEDGKQLTIKSTITVVDPKPLKITGDRFICPPAKNTVLTAESGPTRYQWYYNGNPILGAIENTYTVTSDKAGQYSVIGSYGKCTSPMSDTVTVVDGCNATLNVTYNGNGSNSGTVPTDEKSPYVEDAEVTVKGLGDLKRTDATFIGWSFTQKGLITAKSDEPTDLKKENDKFTIKTDTTLYATWAVDKKGPNGQGDNVPDYLQNGVTYNGNHSTSGAAPTDDNLYNANTQVEVKDSGSLVRTGAAFVGWSFTQKELIKKASEVPSDLKTKGQNFTITQDTTLFAVWGEDKTGPNGTSDGIPDYLQKGLTYNGNNQTSGDAPVDNNRYNSGTSVAVKDSGTMVRTEAVFLGWSFAQKGLITQAADEPADLKKTGAHFNITADTTLFAVWAIDKTGPDGTPDGKPDYSQAGVTYKGNDNTGGTAPVDSKLYNDNDDVKVLDKGDLVRTDAVFLGWLFEQKPLITKKADVPATIYQKDATFKYSANQKTLFALWGEDKTGPNGTSDGIADYLQNGVTYNGNNQSSGAAPVDANRYNNGENVTVKDSGSLARTEAVFIGWSFTQKPVITKAADEPADLKKKGATFASTSDTTLYAVWAIDKTGPNGTPDGKPDYSQDGVTYHANGASGTAPQDANLYNDGDQVTIKDKGDLALNQTVFIGWHTSSVSVVTTAAAVPADMKQPNQQVSYSSALANLYAVWGEDKTGPNGQSDNVPDYLQKGVTYVGNGNDGGTAPVDNNRYNDSTMVTVKGKGTLTRTKAAFIGWSFSTSSLITAKADEPIDLMKPDTAIRITSDLTFHAVWAKDANQNGIPDYDEVDITWNPGFQPRAGKQWVETVTKGDLRLTNSRFAIRGYVLIGWSDRMKPLVTSQAIEDKVTPLYKVGASLNVIENRKLFAVWALDKNNDGSPDYKDGTNKLESGRISLLRGTSEDQTDQTAPQLEAASIRVWAHEGVLYIESDRRTRAEVYTRSGALYKRIDVAEGQTREPLAEGFYVVVIDGKTHKVVVR